ncbi:hypothetical protein FA95DRAFT_1600675 [Auriscalpium vulgare]|uniref:Uncharacterized protein n=1 Tax=Auriscalpium vulgare TaxID=40419 RepID=A0ACB8SAH8_9AGAM|nr:hypothetical protein FA95DRAFT_1600675 [Auriscalpium vulgare]
MEGQHTPHTDYCAFVVDALTAMTRLSGTVDQHTLRQCLGLASSYLLTDVTMDPAAGASTWFTGVNRIVDVMVALHARRELELETFNAASKACSECWMVAGNWPDLEECRRGVRAVAAKLKTLLDENGNTFQGGRVYIP